MTDLDDLIRGAWDLHCLCYPELSLAHRSRQDDIELVSGVASRGMAGVVLKSHFWPTPALTTDACNAWIPPEPELFRWGVGVPHGCGIPEASLRRLIVDNPRTLLGLDDREHDTEAPPTA